MLKSNLLFDMAVAIKSVDSYIMVLYWTSDMGRVVFNGCIVLIRELKKGT